jgi:hypothetical protein
MVWLQARVQLGAMSNRSWCRNAYARRTAATDGLGINEPADCLLRSKSRGCRHVVQSWPADDSADMPELNQTSHSGLHDTIQLPLFFQAQQSHFQVSASLHVQQHQAHCPINHAPRCNRSESKVMWYFWRPFPRQNRSCAVVETNAALAIMK